MQFLLLCNVQEWTIAQNSVVVLHIVDTVAVSMCILAIAEPAVILWGSSVIIMVFSRDNMVAHFLKF